MTVHGILQSICRYPLKGFTGQTLPAADLHVGQGIAHDRRFAVANGWLAVDPSGDWSPCQGFLRLNRNRGIGRIRVDYDAEREAAVLRHPDGRWLEIAFADPASLAAANAELARWFEPGPLGPPQISEAKAGYWDHGDALLSIINVASVRSVSAAAGVDIDPLRFRGNLMLEGLPAWAEFDWPGRTIEIGDSLLEILRPIERCGAPSVNPDTGENDVNVLGVLANDFGHKCMGVYARVRRSARVSVGAAVHVSPIRQQAVIAAAMQYPDALSADHWPRPAAIDHVEPCGVDVAHVWVSDPALDGQLVVSEAKAGQHMRLHTPEAGWRDYTTTARRGASFRITVKRVDDGVMSPMLHGATAGDRLLVSGPFGDVVYPDDNPKSIVIFAAGIGITPAFTLLREAAKQSPQPDVLLISVSRAEALTACWPELEDIVARLPTARVARYVTGTDAEGSIRQGMMPGRPDFASFDWREHAGAAFFVCGAPSFVTDCRQALTAAGIAQDRIHDEPFVSPRRGLSSRMIPPPSDGPFKVVLRSGADNREVEWRGEDTLLALTDSIGVKMPAQCRSGVCGKCRKQVAAGRVHYVTEPTANIPEGFALLCCSVPVTDLDIIL